MSLPEGYVFADSDPDDAFTDGVGADPEQVARRLHELRAYLDERAGAGELPAWAALDPEEREVALGLVTPILEWLRREGTA